jgi:hypothetical protein
MYPHVHHYSNATPLLHLKDSMVESQCTHRTSMENHKGITKFDLRSEMSLNTNSAWHYLSSMILGKVQKNLTAPIRLNNTKCLAEPIQISIRLFKLSSTMCPN